MGGIAKPVRIVGNLREFLALRVDAVARPRHRHSQLRIAARDPLLLQIRICEIAAAAAPGVFGGAMLLNRGVTVNVTALAPKRNRAEGRPGAAFTRIRVVFMAAIWVVET